MKCWRLEEDFGIGNLKLRKVEETASPRVGEVLVGMKAVSLNYRDLLTVEGSYNPDQPLPLIPCSDGSGRVLACGSEVRRFKEGDRVTPTFSQSWIAGRPDYHRLRDTLGGPRDGTLTQLMMVHENGLVKVPSTLTDEEAACLPCAALTAWTALVTEAGLKAGDRVLIIGSGGVSVFGLQFAVAMGARAIAISSSDEKLRRLRSLGISEGLNYEQDSSWGELVREWSGGEGVDHVLEVGGAGTLSQSLQAVRTGGTISLIGVLAGVSSKLNILPILMKKVRIQGILVGHRDSFEAMNRAIESAGIHPVIDRTFSFESAPDAFHYLKRQEHLGKVVIRL